MITIIPQKVAVFLAPMTLPITSMLGRESAGPASSRARAGPWPMPAPRRPCKIGTSVRVAKYIKAPANEAIRLAENEFPPKRDWTHCSGIRAGWPGRPRRKPATKTPPARSGKICFINPQVDSTQLLHSSRVNQDFSMKPRIIRRAMVIYHLAAKIAGHKPVDPGAGFAKAANTSIRTIVNGYRVSWNSVRSLPSESGT